MVVLLSPLRAFSLGTLVFPSHQKLLYFVCFYLFFDELDFYNYCVFATENPSRMLDLKGKERKGSLFKCLVL